MKLKINPTQRVAIILALCAIGAIWTNWANFSTKIFLHLATTLGFGLILFYIFKFISKKPKNIWNTAISCLILFLVINYGFANSDLVFPLIATFITIFSKFYLEPKGSPIINPVVLGLLLGLLITKFIPGLDFISWWGASYKIPLGFVNYSLNLPLVLIFLWIIGGLNLWRKLPLLISFLVFHAAFLTIKSLITNPQNFDFLIYTFTTGTIYFFAAIMLIEPRTSPMLKKQQIIYALIAAIIYNTLTYFKISHFDLLTIAGANLYFFATKFIKFNKPAPMTPPPPTPNLQ